MNETNVNLIGVNKYLFMCIIIFTTITTMISCGCLILTIIGFLSM